MNAKQAEVEQLRRNVDIHKEVEKELAKRSHFCQKVIKRLKQENQELLEKLEAKGGHHSELSPTGTFGTTGKRNNAFSASKTVRHNEKGKLTMADEMRVSEEMINILEAKLEQHETNLKLKKAEYEALQQEYYALQDKFSQSRHKYKRAALIMTDFLEDMINK